MLKPAHALISWSQTGNQLILRAWTACASEEFRAFKAAFVSNTSRSRSCYLYLMAVFPKGISAKITRGLLKRPWLQIRMERIGALLTSVLMPFLP